MRSRQDDLLAGQPAQGQARVDAVRQLPQHPHGAHHALAIAAGALSGRVGRRRWRWRAARHAVGRGEPARAAGPAGAAVEEAPGGGVVEGRVDHLRGVVDE